MQARLSSILAGRNQTVNFEAPLPKDFKAALKLLHQASGKMVIEYIRARAELGMATFPAKTC